MKLQAVTICINYSDYLGCVLGNRRHFDRWIIMTIEGDTKTQSLCDAHGIECFTSGALSPTGSDFHAAFNKSQIINEGLDCLDPMGWAVVIDADILLPRQFRERIQSIPLEDGCLYGMSRRRVCRDFETFQLLRDVEPWEHGLGSSQPLGFLHMFALGSLPNRYSVRRPGSYALHDDDGFSALFPAQLRRCLPMSPLHLGMPESNWSSRTTPQFTTRKSPAGESAVSTDLTAVLNERFFAPIRAASVGYFPGGHVKHLLKFVSHLYLLDQYRIHAANADPVLAADRRALRAIFEGDLQGAQRVTLLGAHSSTNIDEIPDLSIDLLYLQGGGLPICETLLEALPLWLYKLKPGAIVCGDMFLHAVWDAGVTAITALLGIPDYIFDSGFWARRLPPDFQASYGRQKRCGGDEAVVIFGASKEDAEPLLLAIHSVCVHWDGPVAVYYRGEEDASLQLACWEFGCELHHLGCAFEEPLPIETDLEYIAQVQPFRRALLLREGMLAVKSLRGVFLDRLQAAPQPKAPCIFDSETSSWANVDPVHVMHCSVVNEAASILVCEGNPEVWPEEPWACWTDEKSALLERFAVDVRVRTDVTVIFIVDSEGFEDLQHHWLGMRFPHTPTLLVPEDVMHEDLWLPGRSQPTWVRRNPEEPASVKATLLAILRTCVTDRVIFLPPTASPLPAAELFLSQSWDRYALVEANCEEAEREMLLTGNRFAPLYFCGMATIEFLRAFASRDEAWFSQFANFSSFMHFVPSTNLEECARFELPRFGWRFRPRFQYVRSEHDGRSAVSASGSPAEPNRRHAAGEFPPHLLRSAGVHQSAGRAPDRSP